MQCLFSSGLLSVQRETLEACKLKQQCSMCAALDPALLFQTVMHRTWYSEIEFKLIVSSDSMTGTKGGRKDEWDKEFCQDTSD